MRMMELSLETATKNQCNSTFRKQKVDSFNVPSTSCQILEQNEFIDLSKLNLSDPENWLFACSSKSDTSLEKWFCSGDEHSDDLLPAKSIKNIDTRTFTRPKKRFTRPSIEKYNEELYGNELSSSLTDSGIQLYGCAQDDAPLTKPLHFDLNQPVSNSLFFDNIANTAMADSFQNMSPPSLVNSMCSSTFANLMENSFIKNDPVLREIRDTDFTGLILQQESEPMFQSITESCSSLNLDAPENLLKKISMNKTSTRTHDEDVENTTVVLNATFAKESDSSTEKTITLNHSERVEDAKAASCEDLNSTFSKKLGSTRALDVNNATIKLSNTFQRRKKIGSMNNQTITRQDLNSTITLESKRRDDKPIENIKRLLDRRPSPSLDLNRLSYVLDKGDVLNATFPNESIKRNSVGSSDSTENLDYMSLSSGSSKSSNKILSMDGINTIVDMPERNVLLMSTPKPRIKSEVLWHNELSPISGRNSDPELSSSEKADVKPLILSSPIKKQKSTGHINSRMPPPKGAGQMTTVKNSIRGSQPNLKMAEPRTYGLQKPSNLNSMGHTLKGSYTSLKPMNPNLPVAPPPLDATIVKNPQVAQVSPTLRNSPPKNENAQFVRPQPQRASGLPRPVTGIPRPVSRIPGPRSVRPVSRSAGQQGRQTNHY